MIKFERGYTRQQAAEYTGLNVRTIDRYIKDGTCKGRMQYVPEKFHYMRLFTQKEVDEMKALGQAQTKRLNFAIQQRIARQRSQRVTN